MTVMSSLDLFASVFIVLFSLDPIINCYQHAAFAVFLREEEGHHFGVRRGFCRTLWYDAAHQATSRYFANWTMISREFSRNELNSLLPAQSSFQILNSTTAFGYRQVAELQQGNFDERLHQTTHIEHDRKLPHKHLKHKGEHASRGIFFIFHALVCSHGVHAWLPSCRSRRERLRV